MTEFSNPFQDQNQFLSELATKAQPKELTTIDGIESADAIPMGWTCFEDLRRYDGWMMHSWQYLMKDFFSILQSLKGRTVRDVVWVNIRNDDPNSEGYNPLSNRGRFLIILNPKTE